MALRVLLLVSGVFFDFILGCCSANLMKNCQVGEFLRIDVDKKLFASNASHTAVNITAVNITAVNTTAVNISVVNTTAVNITVVNTTAVKITASVYGSPDLPKWLRIEQDTPEKPAIIYGTPPVSSPNNLTLEITGWDKSDYSTKRQNITLLIDNTKEPPRYIAEFIIKNVSLDEFLSEKIQPKMFKDKVKKTWKLDDLQVTKVESLLDRGGRVPIPPAKEGVFIAVGGNQEKMYNLIKADYQGCSGLKPDVKQIFDSISNQWEIDWCKFRLLDTHAPVPTGNSLVPQPSFNGIIQSTYSPPEMKPVPRDFGDLYVVVLILPIIIILIIAIILAVIMCCFQQGKDKRDVATPRPQRDYHDSILRTTFQLRQMQPEQSEQNGSRAPRPENPTGTPTSYERSITPDDESPRGAPPPYRMPPPAAVNVTSPNGKNQFYPASVNRRKATE